MREKNRNIWHRVAIAIICISIISYTVFHMVSLFSAGISTIVVRSSTEETKLEFDGYIFRDETVVYSDYGGAVDYIANDGLKVGGGEGLAIVFEEGNNTNISETVDQLDKKIEVIENSVNQKLSLSELPAISENVGNYYEIIMKSLADDDIKGIGENIGAMTSEMGKVSILTDKDSQLKVTLQRLKDERKRLMSAGGNSQKLVSDRSGYFYSGVDGYENIFTLEAAENMTPDKFHEYASCDANRFEGERHPVGKMVYDSEWRFVSYIPRADSKHFKEGETYRTSFTGYNDITIPLTLQKMTADENAPFVLCIFESDRMPSGFDFERAQSVELTVESVTGINVPKFATHKSQGGVYVYVLKGSVVFERRLEIIYEGSDYYTAKDGVEPDDEDIYLQSNDTLILKGQNLFDGRILE